MFQVDDINTNERAKIIDFQFLFPLILLNSINNHMDFNEFLAYATNTSLIKFRTIGKLTKV